MDRSDKDKVLLSVQEQGTEWYVRSKNENLSLADRRAQTRWLKQSPQNIGAVLWADWLHAAVRDAKIESEPWENDGQSNVIDDVFGRDDPSATSTRQDDNARRWKLATASATFALVVVLAGVIAKVAWFDRTIATVAGEWRTQVLTDGSTVRLGPRTRMRIAFGDRDRFVDLARGEAVFQVAKDARRPFIVDASMAKVRAVGTEFAVTRADHEVVVTVAEGTVAVSTDASEAAFNRNPPQPDGKPGDVENVMVSAGQQIAVSGAQMFAVHSVNVTRALAWVHGRLIFDDTPIGEAVSQFNRRNRLQIEVPDNAIAARAVGGVFDAADPQSFAEFLHTVAPVTVVRDGSAVLRIEPAALPERHDTQRLHAEML